MGLRGNMLQYSSFDHGIELLFSLNLDVVGVVSEVEK